jgi:hypothetical protein
MVSAPVRFVGGAFSYTGSAIASELLARGLVAGLLVSSEPPRGGGRFSDGVVANGSTLVRRYTSALGRNFRGQE